MGKGIGDTASSAWDATKSSIKPLAEQAMTLKDQLADRVFGTGKGLTPAGIDAEQSALNQKAKADSQMRNSRKAVAMPVHNPNAMPKEPFWTRAAKGASNAKDVLQSHYRANLPALTLSDQVDELTQKLRGKLGPDITGAYDKTVNFVTDARATKQKNDDLISWGKKYGITNKSPEQLALIQQVMSEHDRLAEGAAARSAAKAKQIEAEQAKKAARAARAAELAKAEKLRASDPSVLKNKQQILNQQLNAQLMRALRSEDTAGFKEYLEANPDAKAVFYSAPENTHILNLIEETARKRGAKR